MAFSVDRLVWAVDGANAALCYVIKDQFSRRALDLYGLWGGTRTSEFSSGRSTLVALGFNKNIALYDVTDGGTRRLVAKRTVVETPPPFLHSVGGSFAARWARVVLKRCSSERGEREKRFYGGGKGERRRTAF